MILTPSQVIDETVKYYHHLFPTLKSELKKSLRRREKRIRQSIARLELELEKCSEWPLIEKEAQLLQGNFQRLKRGNKFIKLEDWESGSQINIPLDPRLTPQDEVSTRFKRVKKLKKGILPLQQMIAYSRAGLAKMAFLLVKLPFAVSEQEIETLRLIGGISVKQEQYPKKSARNKPKPYIEFFSEAQIPIWVGKNAKNNDLLTFHHANGLDTWLHAADCPGSHVVIRTPKGEAPDQETLNDAIELALHYSKAKNHGSAEVVVTLKKHVTRFGKNQPGKVQLSNPKTIFAKQDPSRLKRLKSTLQSNKEE